MPTVARVARLRVGGLIATAVYREWKDGDPARCRLCATCAAHRATPASPPACLLLIARDIARADAPLFSAVGMQEQRGAGAKGGGQ